MAQIIEEMEISLDEAVTLQPETLEMVLAAIEANDMTSYRESVAEEWDIDKWEQRLAN